MGDKMKFTEDHEWILVEGDIVTIGITEYAKNALGELIYVELPEVGDIISAGDDQLLLEYDGYSSPHLKKNGALDALRF